VIRGDVCKDDVVRRRRRRQTSRDSDASPSSVHDARAVIVMSDDDGRAFFVGFTLVAALASTVRIASPARRVEVCLKSNASD